MLRSVPPLQRLLHGHLARNGMVEKFRFAGHRETTCITDHSLFLSNEMEQWNTRVLSSLFCVSPHRSFPSSASILAVTIVTPLAAKDCRLAS
ncbi:hypothetical protein NPIL_346671 [Nephila pilipes]|uniref:Uncharacterized protein n=1 Tax=Nephila pilipes TaxID=299642 RepID=A0A8X6T9Y0_NEPPI|nr:hypothetical protein NPIL_346671 [Nephila pilipes]